MPFLQWFNQILWFDAVVAAIVFGLVCTILTFALIRYRSGARAASNQHTEHTMLEASYALVLLGAAVFIFFWTSHHNNSRGLAPTDATVKIKVTSFQWCWSFEYEKQPITVAGSCATGDYPTIVVPEGEPVQFDVTSVDVIHSMWLPHFRYKLDAFPGRVNTYGMSFPDGVWLGECAEFCGLYHYTMHFYVHAVPRSEYQSWVTGHGGQLAASGGGGA